MYYLRGKIDYTPRTLRSREWIRSIKSTVDSINNPSPACQWRQTVPIHSFDPQSDSLVFVKLALIV